MEALASARGARIQVLPGVDRDFQVLQKLGQGAFGTTYLAKQRSTGDPRVLKVIRKNAAGSVPRAQLAQEIEVLKALDHPNIIRIFGHHEDADNVYIVMEPAEGGELLAVIQEVHTSHERPLSEAWAAAVFQQCLSAMVYCHARGVLHKDLKAENIMLLGKDRAATPHAVVIDFGIAELLPAGGGGGRRRGHVVAGTYTTMAPGVWRGDFGPKCDVWSLGCVLFHVLSGRQPFMAKNTEDANEWLRLQQAGPDWGMLRNVSTHATGLCQRMLAFDERVRPTAQQCLGHRWFANAPGGALDSKALQALCMFQEQSAAEREMYMDLVCSLNGARLEHLTQLFRACDADGSGMLSPEELLAALRAAGVDEGAAVRAASRLRQSGRDMEYAAFLAATASACDDLMEDLLRREFVRVDPARTGRLGRQGLTQLLRRLGHGADIQAFFAELRTNAMGTADFDEFSRCYKQTFIGRPAPAAASAAPPEPAASACKPARQAGAVPGPPAAADTGGGDLLDDAERLLASINSPTPEPHRRRSAVPGEVAEALFEGADLDSNGLMSQAEFDRWARAVLQSPQLGLSAHDLAWTDFKVADANGDGGLDPHEWHDFLDAIAEVTGPSALKRLAADCMQGMLLDPRPLQPASRQSPNLDALLSELAFE